MTGSIGSARPRRSRSTGNLTSYFGQIDLNVQYFLVRFVVEGSVEERILQLQEKKLNLANDVLTGAKRTGANKLSFDDLKMLFQVG